MTAITQTLNAVWRREGKPDWLLLIILAIPLAVAIFDPAQLLSILSIAGASLAKTSIYIAIAVGLLAYLKATGAESLVAQAFTGSIHRMILLGGMVGGLAPFCSCEVIPFIASLLALGAPLPAVMAFWLSSPLMDPAQFVITAEALGVEYSIAKTIAAVAIGMGGGYLLYAFTSVGAFADPLKPQPAKKGCGCGPSPFSGKPVWRFWKEEKRVETFRATALDQAIFLLRWLALAYLLEAVIITYMPANIVATAIGGEGVWPVIVSAFIGMPAYLNGLAAPAMLDGLMTSVNVESIPTNQWIQPGAVLTFMLAGAVSSIPAMAAVYSLVKRPVFAAYLALGLGGAVLSGLIFSAVVG